MANSVNPGQLPRSDLVLLCLFRPTYSNHYGLNGSFYFYYIGESLKSRRGCAVAHEGLGICCSNMNNVGVFQLEYTRINHLMHENGPFAICEQEMP